jgi:hypothetical protein
MSNWLKKATDSDSAAKKDISSSKMSVPIVTIGENTHILSVKTDSIFGMLFITKKYIFYLKLPLRKAALKELYFEWNER